MGHLFRGHVIVASILILAFLIISGRKVDVRIRTPQCFDIHFDEMFSDIAKTEVTTFIESLDKRWALKTASFALIIKEQFPFIQSIQFRLVPPGTMKLMCKAYKPICIINQTLLLVLPQTLCSTAHFQETTWASLPNISVEQSLIKEYDPKALVSIVSAIGNDIFDQYHVTLCSQGNLVFDDKKQPRLSLICRFDKVPSKTLGTYGNYMREMLENRNAFSEKSAHNFVADLRFEKQIILSKK